MRRGCMSVGDVVCHSCGRLIKHPEQYLALDSEDILPGDNVLDRMAKNNAESYAEVTARRSPLRFCTDCCLRKGYAAYQGGKAEKSLTFFEKRTDM